MKIKKDYRLRTVAGQNIVIPSQDEDAAFQGALVLNSTGAFIWRLLETDNTRQGLIDALTTGFEVTGAQAAASVDNMLETFKKYGVLEP